MGLAPRRNLMKIKMKTKKLSFMMMNLKRHFHSPLLVVLIARLSFHLVLTDHLIFVFIIFSTFVITPVLVAIVKVHLNRYWDHLKPLYAYNLG